MQTQTLKKDGRVYALVPIETWRKMTTQRSATKRSAAKATRPPSPPAPPVDAQGNSNAIAYARMSIARTLIAEREAAGLSQAELARWARMDRSTLNRIERAKVTLDETTYRRLRKAIKDAAVHAANPSPD